MLLAAIQSLGPVLRDALAAQTAGDIQPLGTPGTPGTVEMPVQPEPAVPDEPVKSSAGPGKVDAQKRDEEREEEMGALAEQLFVTQLVASAESGGQQEQWIKPILAVIPAEDARELLTGDGVMDDLAQINPAVRDHEPWFARMGEVLMAHLDGLESDGAGSAR